MINFKKCDYEYTGNAEQYQDVDFSKFDIVDAQYRKVPGYEGNPDVEALPEPYTGPEVLEKGIFIPDAVFNEETDPLLRTSSFRRIRIPLAVQGTINRTLYHGIVNSYASRSYSVTEHPVTLAKSDPDDDDVTVNTFSTAYSDPSPHGASIIGPPGTGKTTSLSITLDSMPRAIRHEIDGLYYIQIPVIRTTAYSKSNFGALVRSFAAKLDIFLDTGRHHRDGVKSGDNGKLAAILIDWIRLYHIGAWIIEEISFFEFSASITNSFENIVTIMAETGVFLMATANKDLVKKMGKNLRPYRRLLSNVIDMGTISRDKHFIGLVVKRMWSYMIPELKNGFSDDIYDAIYECTLGSIDMISLLLCFIQQEYIRKKKRHQKVCINPDFIKAIANEKIWEMRELFTKNQINELETYRKKREELEDELNIDTDAINTKEVELKLREELETGYDHQRILYELKKSNYESDLDYTDKQIEAALSFCEKNITGFMKMKPADIKRSVNHRLKTLKETRKGKKTKTAEANYYEMVKELLGEDPA